MRQFVTAAAAAVLAITVLTGCATAPKKPTDAELIRGTVEKVKTALETKNLDLLMSTFAEDFTHPQAGDKKQARTMLQLGMDSGYADGGKVDLSNMTIKMDPNGTATVYPVDLSSPKGSVAVTVILAKEQGQWLIKTLDADI